uniref:C2H2-type domain-containing protein n=1 Tax=viral metagenome TaxID=1070528 RepID=A0A6C0EPI3_9ZZZZ
MDIPLGWRLDPKCRYTCMCDQFRTEDISEVSSHMSTEFEGYCIRGLKCIEKDKFECICGDKFLETKQGRSTRTQAYYHVCEQMEKQIQVCVNQFRNKCQQCKIQLDTPKGLRRHLLTKSHLNFENKVDLHCKICDFKADCQKEMLTHLATKKHIDNANGIEKKIHDCVKCNYKTKFKSQFEQHELTKKHQNNVAGIEKPLEYICKECSYSTTFKHCLDQHNRTKKHLSTMT